MCGIVGIVSRTEIEKHSVQFMTDALKHRGPDAESIYLDETKRVALGHTRLSIIDLSNEANQPMYSHDGRYIIVFNGEIYNFLEIKKQLHALDQTIQFQTHSDTEVILHAFAHWNVGMAERLQGMFAIVIYDAIDQKVFLFRDRVGKKPLYYFSNEKCFCFASEIKALLRHPEVQHSKQVDVHAVHEFLHLGYVAEPKTIYKSIRKFPAGFAGELNDDFTLKLYPYWNVEEKISTSFDFKSDGQVKNLLREKLHSAVKKRLISDVPLGTFLSGGTDSSLVTAIAAEHTDKPIKTFSIGFKENKFNESSFSSQVAGHLKTDHHQYILSESEAADMLEQYLVHFDEPFADTSAIPTMLVSKLARKEVTVALTGDGGDELFLGYGSYDWAERLSNPLLRTVQQPLAYLFNHSGNSRLARVGHLLEKVDRPLLRSHIFSQEQYFFSHKEVSGLLKDNSLYQPFIYNDRDIDELTEADKQALFDLKYYLKDDLLVKVDRASMFYSLECRCPLLDQGVIEFAVNLPDKFKKREDTSKWLLKELLKEYLPAELVDRPKWGFGIPLGKWLKNRFRYLIDEHLDKKTIEEAGIVRVEYVEKLKKSFFQGQEYLYNRIWVLVVLHKWMKDNKAV
jgi:asparagine synthase (glutamine-hydrolysing)